jgi:hypothetical protein
MSKKEIWKTITIKGMKKSPLYVVSNHGRFGVKDPKTGKVEVRTYHKQHGGYRFTYRINGISKSISIYKEVAKAFVKKSSPKHTMIIRKDHDYFNDHSGNLVWATVEQHKEHVTNSPASVKSRKNRAIVKSITARILDEKKAREIKKLIWAPKRKLTFKQIAEKYGVSEMQIYRIKKGELWFHVKVDNEPEHPKYKQNLKNLARLEAQSNKRK